MLKELENWKPIEGFEGLYEISDWGRVRSLGNGGVNQYKGKTTILKPTKDKQGYLRITLHKNKKLFNRAVHRLVANAFIPNPNNYSIVNHLTECKLFNHFSCLEWCTQKHNLNYGISSTIRSQNKKKPINQYSKDGVLLKKWMSATDIEIECGFRGSNITACCKHHKAHHTAYGFLWEYA